MDEGYGGGVDEGEGLGGIGGGEMSGTIWISAGYIMGVG